MQLLAFSCLSEMSFLQPVQGSGPYIGIYHLTIFSGIFWGLSFLKINQVNRMGKPYKPLHILLFKRQRLLDTACEFKSCTGSGAWKIVVKLINTYAYRNGAYLQPNTYQAQIKWCATLSRNKGCSMILKQSNSATYPGISRMGLSVPSSRCGAPGTRAGPCRPANLSFISDHVIA